MKALEQSYCDYEPMCRWGRFTRLVEIGDDHYPLRHVDMFENGHVLRYDRTHWTDEFGILADMRYDEKKFKEWWGPAVGIEPSEFEEHWRLAENSPTWPVQLGSAKMAEMGKVPVWLLRLNDPPDIALQRTWPAARVSGGFGRLLDRPVR